MNVRNESRYSSIVFTVLLWITVVFNTFSQDYLFDTEIINVKDGLPHRNTFAITQDKEGFIWISTQSGISRYDGYRFKNYPNPDLNITEINLAHYMASDHKNRLWYAEAQIKGNTFNCGVIDTRKDTIYTAEAISGGLFTSKDVIYIGNSGVTPDVVFIATRNGIVYAYDGDFTEIYRFPEPLTSAILFGVLPDKSYWIFYKRQAIRIKEGKRLQRITAPLAVKKIIATHPKLIIETTFDTKHKYWILDNNRFVPYAFPGGLPKGSVTPLQLHDDYHCYATADSLFISDLAGKPFRSFTLNSLGLEQGIGWKTTYIDGQNTLWITTGNGLLKITPRKNPFTIMKPGVSIRGIYRDGDQLWIGGHGSSVVRNTVSGGQKKFWEHFYAAVMSFYKDDRGTLWIGTSAQEIIQYLPDTDTYRYHILNLSLSLHLMFQNPITRQFWIGTNDGIFRFDRETIKFSPFELPVASENVYVRQFYQNDEGIWIVTSKGLFLMDDKKEVILKQYTTADGLPTTNLNHLYEDNNGIFWIGTKGEGLVRWDRSTNIFQQFTRNEGLSNNTIYAVYEDDYGTLWLPSDHGLMAFDKTTQTTRIYLPRNGIAHEEFNTHAHFKDEDGTLYFGGLDGVIKFHPAAFQQQYTTAPPLHATGIRILRKGAETFTDETSTYNTTKKISLKPGDRILELDLTLLDYEKSSENQYAYKLSGKQEQWIYTTDNKITVIGPPYGRYDLLVKARGASGQWSDKLLTIPLYVRTPFYLQWWFFVSVAFAIISSVFIVIRWRVQKLKKDRKRLEDEVLKRTKKIAHDKLIIEEQAAALKALDEAKSRFFANITHEFRTPLTLVTGPLERLLSKKLPGSVKSELKGVLKNGRSLLGLINQLLDLSKLEGGRMKVEVSHGDIVHYTRELVQHFQPLAEAKQLQLEFIAEMETWKIHFDSDKWTKIIYNLLSNAVKFTHEGGIAVHLKQAQQSAGQCVQLSVKDTGIGIAPEKLEHIFDRFYQADASSTRLQGGTGIGLSLVKELAEFQNGAVTVNSTIGHGTEFTVTLPVIVVSDNETVGPVITPEDQLFFLSKETSPPQNGQVVTPHTQERATTEKLELLIVEDNAEMRAYIRSCIDETTYRITEAADGEQGIEKALEIVPDLIISDVMMPEKNGFELTKAIREHTATSHIPLILLTAKASLESRLEGLERGADAYLTKPFNPQELTLRIQKLIELRQALQRRYREEESPEANSLFEKEDSFVSGLRTYIYENMSNPELNGEHISRHFGMSRRQLYRKLEALKNNSLADYVRTLRLDKAVQLIKEQQLNISEIAYEIGFSSPAHFSRTFKKVYGRAPSEWN